MSTLGDLLRCPVCAQIFDQPCDFECSHTVCATCIDRMIEQKSQETDPPTPRALIVLLPCPVCRQLHEISSDRFPLNYVIRDIVELYRRQAANRICDCTDVVLIDAPDALATLKTRTDTYKQLADARELTIRQLTAVTVRDHQTKQRLEAELRHAFIEIEDLRTENERLDDEATELKFRIQHLTTRCNQKESLARFHATVAEENGLLKDNYRLQIRELEVEVREKNDTIENLRRQAANLRNQILQERLEASNQADNRAQP